MMRILLAGAAAIALAASGAYAQPGKNGDNGNGPGNGKHNNAAKVERGPPDRGPQRPGNKRQQGCQAGQTHGPAARQTRCPPECLP